MTANTQNERLLKFLQAPTEVQAEIDRILDGKAPAKPETTVTGPLLLGMTAAARFLGVSRPTLWRMCKAGRLKKVELFPGCYRLRRADLEDIAIGRQKTG